PAAGWLLVRSEPPGATVTVDGVDRGRTPLALSDLPFDTYRVEVRREGFRSAARQLALTPAATVASIQIELQRGADPPPAPVVGALLVESRPPGARVVIDGREVGTTPTVVSDVAAGTRSVRIELDGYRPWEAAVDVPASDQIRVGASLDLLSRR
ncbi:MAG: PEGA domain-containing protein, partial [Acidobacteriota bacterium]|nr:PEGA domain-containing protein [Acidobacteriota bacterium]